MSTKDSSMPPQEESENPVSCIHKMNTSLSLPDISYRSASLVTKKRKMTTTLPEELCGDSDDYRSQLGPGSYNTPRLYESSTHRRSPSFSMGARYSLKGHYISPEQGINGYGSDSPGVGKYSSDQEVKLPRAPKIGTGPKCPESNFHLPAISPGPAYSNPDYKGIIQTVKNRSSSTIKGPKRELTFQENITGPVPSVHNYKVPTEFEKKFKEKREIVPREVKSKLQQLWEMKIRLAKRRELLPGPGSYTIDKDRVDRAKYSFPKATRNDDKKDAFELAGPGRYSVDKPVHWSNIKKDPNAVFSKAHRMVDVRKWGYKSPA